MIGTMIGDIAGSRYEGWYIKTKDFEMFHRICCVTDDSIMTLAVAEAILNCNGDYRKLSEQACASMQRWGRMYPNGGYGDTFEGWIFAEDPQPYNSWGNGSAMRAGPCGWAANSIDEACRLAYLVSCVSHNHPEGIKGAAAVAVAVYMAKTGETKDSIRQYIHDNFYPMDFTLDEIREEYEFEVSCQGSVPQSLMAFLESDSTEDAVRNAVSLGGDTDTMAAIVGSVAEAYYGIPESLRSGALAYMDETQKEILDRFESKFGSKYV